MSFLETVRRSVDRTQHMENEMSRMGIYLIENMKLDELAERKIFESTVIMLPTRYRGATGSPVRVIALR